MLTRFVGAVFVYLFLESFTFALRLEKYIVSNQLFPFLTRPISQDGN